MPLCVTGYHNLIGLSAHHCFLEHCSEKRLSSPFYKDTGTSYKCLYWELYRETQAK